MNRERAPCVFCGSSGRLIGEHVFGDFSKIGLSGARSALAGDEVALGDARGTFFYMRLAKNVPAAGD